MTLHQLIYWFLNLVPCNTTHSVDQLSLEEIRRIRKLTA